MYFQIHLIIADVFTVNAFVGQFSVVVSFLFHLPPLLPPVEL